LWASLSRALGLNEAAGHLGHYKPLFEHVEVSFMAMFAALAAAVGGILSQLEVRS